MGVSVLLFLGEVPRSGLGWRWAATFWGGSISLVAPFFWGLSLKSGVGQWSVARTERTPAAHSARFGQRGVARQLEIPTVPHADCSPKMQPRAR